MPGRDVVKRRVVLKLLQAALLIWLLLAFGAGNVDFIYMGF